MPGVFISYRRDDSSGYAGRLYDALVAHFGSELVFIDIDSIRAGQNFPDVIDKRIAACSVVVVLIGKGWLKSVDDRGDRRLDDPHDFVRLEIASALAQKIPVIPVLVGGAKMPRPDDLPEPLKLLAHLNAIEIFDQLFHDSVKRFINALQPFVRPKLRLWPWEHPIPRKARLLLIAVTLSIVVAIIATLGPGPDRHTPEADSPPASATVAGPDDSNSPSARVKVMKPPEISELPPVVEASRKVLFPGSSDQVTGPGPVNPRIVWRATVTIGDAWHVIGIAADSTVYVWDAETLVLAALRDGKEVWAYSDFYKEEWNRGSYPAFTTDGRVWVGDYCFNSRGEGGHVTRRNLRPDPATLRHDGQLPQNKYGCDSGQVYGMSAGGRKTWSVDLDGNCGSQSPVSLEEGGNIYATSDARTLYSITPAGQLLWKVEQACKKSDVYVHPLPVDDLIVICRDQSLYCLRGGKPRWTFAMDATEGWSWWNTISDKSGTIYVGAEGPSAMTQLAAVNDSGKLIWKAPGGIRGSPPAPVGFDPQGRLYVNAGGRIVCLSN